MEKSLPNCLRTVSGYHLGAILVLSLFSSACLVFSLADQPYFWALFHNYWVCSLLFFCAGAVYGALTIGIGALLGTGRAGIRQALVILASAQSIFFWPVTDRQFSLLMPVLIIGVQALALFCVFRSPSSFEGDGIKEKKYLCMMAVVYALALYLAALRSLHTLSFFNARDFAIYNQTFWNTVHGRLFQNSTYGSNLACHNTWFYLLLTPVYYLVPHPETLLALKIGLLALAVIPYYLNIKDSLYRPGRLVMGGVFLFFPFFIAQAFTPPHEMGFAPFVILFTYFFFRRNAFVPFLVSCIVMLSIKEHLALIAVMFGVFAFFSKKGLRWIAAPVVLGILWAGLSYAVITHAQAVYHANTDASWLLTDLKQWAVHTGYRAGAGSPLSVKLALLLVAPLGFIVPFFSATWILGMPEFALNLVAGRPCMFAPQLHYNIAVSSFLLIACAEGMRTISGKRQFVLSIIILSLTLMHSYTWLPLTRIATPPSYASRLRAALALVPVDAFVTVPQQAAILVSNRPRYALLEEGVLGDFVVTDQPRYPAVFNLTSGYVPVYTDGGISLFKKSEN